MLKRQRGILIILAALVLLFILATGINGLVFNAGKNFDIKDAAALPGLGASGRDEGDLFILLLRGLVALTVILLPFYLIYMLIDPQRRKRLLGEILGYLLFIGMVVLIQNYLANRPSDNKQLQPTLTPAVQSNQPPAISKEPAPTFNANASDNIITATGIGIGVLIVAAITVVGWLFLAKGAAGPQVLVQVANEAEETIEALLAGKNLRDTILLCYRRMTEIAVKNRGVPREASMTPGEFEEILVTKGLPALSVRELTHLFEEVRYGDVQAGEEERRRAVLALRTIAAACRQMEEEKA